MIPFLILFLGSGTTSLSAIKLSRNSIGYEINEEFLPVIKEKLGLNQKSIFEDSFLEIKRQDKIDINFKEKIKKLPYILETL